MDLFKKILLLIILIAIWNTVFAGINILVQFFSGFEAFNFQEYSWVEWLFQILYWLITIPASVLISIDIEKNAIY